MTFDGGGKTVSFSNTGRASNFVVTASGSEIKNVIVENTADNEEWTGTYCIQLYGGEYTVSNVTAKGGNAGIIVNGAKVTLGENVDVSGNVYGGIEVSKGEAEGLQDAELIVTAPITNTTEAYGKPTVWIDGEGATVTDSTGMTATTSVKPGQTQYYINAENATE